MTTPQKPNSQIVWPRPALAGCIFCMIVRDTRGVTLDHAQRFNFFPASPLCCVSGIVAGDLHLIARPEQMRQPWSAERLPRLFFSGAQLGPLVSWNPGETYTVTVAFYPDAFSAMTGLDLSGFTGRMVAAEHALPAPLLDMWRQFFDTVEREGVQTGFTRLESRLEAAWSAARPAGNRAMRRLKDWSSSVVLRAVLSGPGCSTRQIARRVRSWTGVNERDLKGLGHTEQLYANIHEAMQNGRIDWAEVAAASGFADQGHMIRRMKQHTGFTPEQLRQVTPTDESLWAYRLLGQYFSKPEDDSDL